MRLVLYIVVNPFYDYTYSQQPGTVLPMNIRLILMFVLQQRLFVISPMFSLDNSPVELV